MFGGNLTVIYISFRGRWRILQHKNEEYFYRIETFINQFYELNGVFPANYIIADALSLSTATISRYVNQMKKDGRLIIGNNNKPQTAKLKKLITETVSIPIIGSISCGTPISAEENIENYIMFPKEELSDGEYFFLRAKGDSMINIGIEDRDLVLIKKQDYVDEGNVAVVLLENEATLKRVYFDELNHRIRLHPENDSMDDFYVKDCIIQGLAVKTIKDIR